LKELQEKSSLQESDTTYQTPSIKKKEVIEATEPTEAKIFD
jgi:hypothetical protein